MANELSILVGLNLTRMTELVNWLPGSVTLNQTGTRFSEFVQLVSTTAPVSLNVPTMGTLGYVMVENMDTNTGNMAYLYDSTSGYSFGQVRPGGFALFELGPDGQAPAAKMLSTAGNLRVLVVEL